MGNIHEKSFVLLQDISVCYNTGDLCTMLGLNATYFYFKQEFENKTQLDHRNPTIMV